MELDLQRAIKDRMLLEEQLEKANRELINRHEIITRLEKEVRDMQVETQFHDQAIEEREQSIKTLRIKVVTLEKEIASLKWDIEVLKKEKQTTEINLDVKPRIEKTTYEITHAMSPDSKSVVTGKPHEVSTLDFSVNHNAGDAYSVGQTTTRIYSRGNSRGNEDDMNISGNMLGKHILDALLYFLH